MSTPPRYRGAHRQPGRSTVVGVLDGLKPHRRPSDPYASRPIHDGESGWAVLVGDSTGAVVTGLAVVVASQGE